MDRYDSFDDEEHEVGYIIEAHMARVEEGVKMGERLAQRISYDCQRLNFTIPFSLRPYSLAATPPYCWAPFSVKGPRVAPKGLRTRWRQKIPKKRITIT